MTNEDFQVELDSATTLGEIESLLCRATPEQAQSLSACVRKKAWGPRALQRARELVAQADRIAGQLPRLPRWPGAANGTAGPVD